MAKSQRLRLKELRHLFQLLGECCELGADPVAWRAHLAAGLYRLLQADVTLVCQWEQVGCPGTADWLQPRLLVDHGWPTASERAVCVQFMQDREVDVDGFWATPEFYRLLPFAAHRRRFVADRDWYGGRFFNEVFRAAHLDDTLLASHQSGQSLTILCAHRALGQSEFDLRQERLLRLLLRECLPLLGGRLAAMESPSLAELSPRQRAVLSCLMEGDSEKQVAARLRISRHTVHNYVKQLHARFGAASRGELLARCRPLWPVLERDADTNRLAAAVQFGPPADDRKQRRSHS